MVIIKNRWCILKVILMLISDFIDFKNEMKEMVENSNSDTKKLKRSVLYEVKKMHEDVVFYLTSRSNSSSLSEIKEKINITEPIKTLETFMEFNSKIHSDKDHAEGLVIFFL